MEFEKYKIYGAYHWSEWENNTIYTHNVNKIVNWVTENKVLDLGAGDGLITHLLLQKGIECIGVDDNIIAVELAKQKGVKVVLGDAYNLSSLNIGYFDAVLMADVIEHFEFPEKVINEIIKVLKPNGCIYVTTPPKRKDGILQDKYHYKEYDAEELKEFMENFKFKLIGEIDNEFMRLYAKFQII